MAATINKKKSILWPSGVVPYSFHANFNLRDTTHEAMDKIEKRTGIRFVRKQPHQRAFIEFRNFGESGSCNSSEIGRCGRKQFINCSDARENPVGLMIHEIFHALGLIHEHQRSDRNNFVNVRPRLAVERFRSNFDRKPNSRNSKDYDFRSVMHYGPRTFAISEHQPPILRKSDNKTVGIGSRGRATSKDWAFLKDIYPHTGIVRRGDSTANSTGRINGVAVAEMKADAFLAAVKTASDRLKVLVYHVSRRGDVRRSPSLSQTAGVVGELGIASDRREQAVAAVTTEHGRLLLISLRLNQEDGLERLDDSGQQAGRATRVRIVHQGRNLYVTACRTTDRAKRLRLIAWRVTNSGKITRLGDTGELAGFIRDVSLTTLNSNDLLEPGKVASTVIGENSEIKTIIWSVTRDGQFRRLSDTGGSLGKGSLIQSAAFWFHATRQSHVVVSHRTQGGKLMLRLLLVSANGRRVGQSAHSGSQAGKVRSNSIALIDTGKTYVSAVKTQGGQLKLIRWIVDRDKLTITRTGDSADLASNVRRHINLIGRSRRPKGMNAISFFQASNSKLMGITWDTAAKTGELNR